MSAPDVPAKASQHLRRDPAASSPLGTGWGAAGARARWLRLFLTELSVVAALSCSSMLLTHIGYHYDHPGGLPFEKFHPASLMLLAAFACLMIEDGLSASLAQILRQYPLTSIYLACVAYYVLYVSLVLGRPVSFVVDTLIIPAITMMLLFRTDRARLKRFAGWIHGLMAINALLGIAESVFGFHLIPIYFAGELSDYHEARSTALLGHPLQNAAISAIYALLLLLGPRGDLRWSWAVPLFLLQLLALPAFGGRTATVLLALLMACWIAKEVGLILLGRPFPLARILWICIGLPAAAILVLQLSDTAYVTTFIDRFIDDSGSAETRVRMFRLFDGFSWGELLLGPDPDMLEYLQFRVGTTLGIESFPIAYILNSGIFAASLIFIGLTAFVADIGRFVSWRSLLAVLMFIALNASSTGLSSKTITFTLLIAIVMAMEGSEPGSRLAGKQRDWALRFGRAGSSAP